HVERLSKAPGGKADETAEYVARAVGLTKRMENFMQGVSKQIQSRELNASFALSPEIEQVMQILAYKARKAGVELVYLPPTQTITNFGNPLKFHQAITNLVSNAIDSYDSENEAGPRQVKVELGA